MRSWNAAAAIGWDCCCVYAAQRSGMRAARARADDSLSSAEGDGLPDDDEPFSKMTGWKSEG